MDLVAGPQGSGKSTFFPVAHRGHDFFNVDDRRRELNRGSSHRIFPEVRQRAIKEYRAFIEQHIRRRQSFAIEVTLGKEITFEQAERARRAGFRVLGIGGGDKVVARKRAEHSTTYQLKVTLMETDPPIWRRLRVPGSTTLGRLDRILQTVMGWTNSHLHTFTAGGILYADPDPEWEIEVKDERRARLGQVAKEEGEAFVYEYDLGDAWRHQVLVEEVRVESEDADGPVCLSGERACPPEDCGGVQGYYETLERLRNPRHPEYSETKTWIESMTGGPFDPNAFDIAAVNAALKRLR